jgi:hypothetical protein
MVIAMISRPIRPDTKSDQSGALTPKDLNLQPNQYKQTPLTLIPTR